MEAKENIARELGLLRGSTQQLEQTWQISGIPIKTTIPFIGWLVTLGKRCIRKSVHWLIAPYWEQQTAFNHTTMEAISELYRIQNGLCGEQPGNLLDGYQRQVNDQQGQIEQYRAEIEKWAEVLLRIDATVREGFSECREKFRQNCESDRSDKQNAILYAYRYLLGREPENTDIVLYNEKDYQELKQTFESAPEYLLKHNEKRLQMDALTTKQLIGKFDFQIDYEEVLEKNYSKLINPGDTVVDIGAHVGRHLRVFERLVTETGSLYGFEPLKKQYGYLTETFQAENVRLFNLALSNFNGETEFWECENYPEESGLKQRVVYNREDARLKSIKVQVKQLDDFMDCFTRLDYIKLDAEGAEVDILEGAARVISKFRPIISTEYGGPGYGAYGRQRRSLFDLCERYNYCVADIFGNPIFDLSEWEECCDSVYWDYFLVPREKLAKFLFCLHN